MIILDKATIVTAEKEAVGTVTIENGLIADVLWSDREDYDFRRHMLMQKNPDAEVWNLEGKHLIAGGIDAHVHFREPGLTHKADMHTESMAAVAGGVTTVFDMPNTKPATITPEALKGKMALAKGRALTKTGFHIGATNDNTDMICSLVREGDPANGLKAEDIPGVKVFMGSSTGNMLVDQGTSLDRLFAIKEKPILVHCEDEDTIKANLATAVEKYGEDIPFTEHEHIRSRRACIKSSIKALEMAIKHDTKLVLCHISTKEEIEMARAAKTNNPSITAETSCNYLWFSNEDYPRLGSLVKCNPSVKTPADREALRNALAEGLIDTIGSDHAPHLLSEKEGPYTKAPSGLPSIQQSLPVLLTIAHEEEIPLGRIASAFSEKAAVLYGLKRGKIEKGYEADLVVFDYEKKFIVKAEDQYSKCGWTPYEGVTLRGFIETVLIDGKVILENGRIKE
ncbi:MAG: amidohydrolase family protein [Bacteroidales bacterium]|nr:amidohydrolase family protein [Bacteroidales bacterium]